MKTRFYLLAFAALFFTSCQISENIYMNDDGSGKISFDIDASGVMAMAGDKMKSEKTKDMDSTFTFKEFFALKKDSISKLPAEEQARLKKMENVSMNIKMNSEIKQFMISMYTNFKKTDELIDMMQGMKSLKPKQGDSGSVNPLDNIGGGSNAELKYSFNGKVFKRTVTIKDKKMQETAKDTTGMTTMLFAGSNYTLKYHFPKKVKSVSNPNAMFSDDRKTVTVLYPFMTYIENPEQLSLEVVLEK
jgi:hypothetical protein